MKDAAPMKAGAKAEVVKVAEHARAAAVTGVTTAGAIVATVEIAAVSTVRRK